MDWEAFKKHQPFAGEKKPSMLRRRVGHDYESRRIYLITMTVEGRRPLLGTLVGNADALDGSPEAPRIEPSPLGWEVQRCWFSIHEHYPEVEVLALQLMPDHLHGILFVTQQMEQHLGIVLKGFKTGCNQAYRSSMPQQCCSKVNEKGTGFLFARNYNDHILEGKGELDHWRAYLRDTPRRLAVRRAHPDYFRVRFGVSIGSQNYAAIGNRFLLQHPEKIQVQCSRSLTDEQAAATVERMLAKARSGAHDDSSASMPTRSTILTSSSTTNSTHSSARNSGRDAATGSRRRKTHASCSRTSSSDRYAATNR